MVSRQSTDVPVDFELLKAALLRREPGLDIQIRTVRRVRGPGQRLGLGFVRDMLAHLRLVASARVVVLDTYSPVVSVPKWADRLRVVQMWHALGALKRFGLDAIGSPDGRAGAEAAAGEMHRGYAVVLASSEAARPHFATALAVRSDQVKVAPLPRVDLLTDDAARQAVRERILGRYPELAKRPVLLYAPTQRRDQAGRESARRLAGAAHRHGWHLVIAPHPIETWELDTDGGSVSIITQPDTSADLCTVAQAFVTDYSSALFEAAVQAVPCYLFAPDLADYEDQRGLYWDLRQAPFPLLGDPDQLMEAVARGESTSQMAKDFAQHWIELPPASPGAEATRCADHVAGIVLEELGRATRR
jgi:CDP-glycerol glycerophosphotransferase (TagB/SpsB family)